MNIVNENQAVELLKSGDLMIVPTETVYGLAADGLNAEAVKKIYMKKGRPSGNPLILHVSSLEMLKDLVKEVSVKSQKLIEAFWPGPLTLVFDKSEKIPAEVCAGLSTVCVRMPKQMETLKIIEMLGHPIAAPSANLSGRPSPTNLAMLEKDMPDVAVVDGGQTEYGLESTVVDARGEQARILRLGSLAAVNIEKVLGEKVIQAGNTSSRHEGLEVQSPGMAFKHYSPRGEVILIWPWESFGEKKAEGNKSRYATVETAYADLYERFKCGIVCSASRESLYFGYEVLSLGRDSVEQAKNLFNILHQTEELGWEKIIVDMTDIDTGEGLAPTIIERLGRSAET